jgi:tRNA modification GTPase
VNVDLNNTDTIVAIASPPGKGGVGVIRISGKLSTSIGQTLCGKPLPERQANYAAFKDKQGLVIDTGLAIYFPAPHSFTGEDVVEIQGHGSPVVQDVVIREIIKLGARPARAGEVSQRAFLNDKVDLAQAEAIADLINSSTEQAAKSAMRSLQGVFSKKIEEILKTLIHLRMYVEAAIDFPEEEIDFLADETVHNNIQTVLNLLETTIEQAGQGRVLRNGLSLVIAGQPNVGKSSLLNALSGEDSAIVTEIPGTTRDTIKETIDIDGLPVHIYDTAGLRDSEDTVEKIGIARAIKALEAADHIIYLVDLSKGATPVIAELEPYQNKVTTVWNKADLVSANETGKQKGIVISAISGEGLSSLKEHIKQLAGYSEGGESMFTARRRHISALEKAQQAVSQGLQQLKLNKAGELLADDLLQAQNALSEITGEYRADDLLGEIFSGFCIGK